MRLMKLLLISSLSVVTRTMPRIVRDDNGLPVYAPYAKDSSRESLLPSLEDNSVVAPIKDVGPESSGTPNPVPCDGKDVVLLGLGQDSVPSSIAGRQYLGPPLHDSGGPSVTVREEGELSPRPSSKAVASGAEQAVPKSWSSVVSSSSAQNLLNLNYFPPLDSDGVITIKPPSAILQKGMSLWSSSAVGYFLHSKLPYKVVEPIANRLWGNLGLSKVYLHEAGYYIFKFNSVLERDHILASGPWHFASKLLVLQPWREGTDFVKAECRKIPIWVKFTNIPLSYWTSEGISYLASGIGKPLFADAMTSRLEPMPFARVCIEVDAEFTFPSSLNVIVFDEYANGDKIIAVNVEYQGRPPSCPVCRIFGHSPSKCPKATFKWIPKTQTEPLFAGNFPVSDAVSPVPAPTANLPMPVKHPLGKPSSSEWTTVASGLKSTSAVQETPGIPALVNSFDPIAAPSSNVASDSVDVESPFMHNPIVDKLRMVDEKEDRDLKNKAGSDKDIAKAPKRRNRGPNGKSPS